MKNLIKIAKIAIFSLLLFLFLEHSVYAYLDPGSGSYFFQLIIAVLLGGIFSIKLFWNKIKIFLRRLFSKNKDE